MNTPFKPGPQESETGVICPHCGHDHQPDFDNLSVDDRTETCGGCGKDFILFQEFTVTHHTRPCETATPSTS